MTRECPQAILDAEKRRKAVRLAQQLGPGWTPHIEHGRPAAYFGRGHLQVLQDDGWCRADKVYYAYFGSIAVGERSTATSVERCTERHRTPREAINDALQHSLRYDAVHAQLFRITQRLRRLRQTHRLCRRGPAPRTD